MAFSNASGKFYVCATAQNSTLDRTAYEALTWVEVGGVGSIGELGRQTNVLTYDTWGESVTQKAKGMTDAGNADLEVARDAADPGQDVLRSVANNPDKYAFKLVYNDGSSGNTGTTVYNRGLILGPRRPNGRNEDFILEIFTLAMVQEEIVVDPVSGSAPVLTVIPTISGTAEVGETLTANNGTFTGTGITYTHQWFAGGVAISGATATTFVLTSAQLGKVITVRVVATNSGGSAQAFSAATSAVAP